MNKIRCYLSDVLLCLSSTQGLVSPTLSSHHQQVAYLAFRLTEQIGFSEQDQKDVFLAGLVHDIGAISSDENLNVIENEPLKPNNHAFLGASLLAGFKPLKNIAPIVRFHHVPWNVGKNELYQGCFVSLLSHVVHLADRFCASLKYPYYNILSQVPSILENINQKSGSIFEPSLVSALNELSKKEYIWLDLISQDPINRLPDNGLSEKLVLEIDDILDFAILLSHIIDFRSKFTACHSAGVAMIAEYLAALLGFSHGAQNDAHCWIPT